MIELDRVTKTYRVYRRKADWLTERVVRRRLHQTKTALNAVSFSVGEGEVLGILGRNGAGKSTLLKLIMGVALPNSGEIRVSGRVTGLLELGTGFNMDLSGRDNIDFNAALLGMTREEIAAKRDAIVAFSELGDAIRDPLRTYSAGMTMRLAFAIAIHAEPACFVVDEALSVGDIHFQQKCMEHIRAFKRAGGSIVFVSHDINTVKVLCDRALVLDRGELVASGDPEFAANRYNRIIAGTDAAMPAPSAESGGGAPTSAGPGGGATGEVPAQGGYGSGEIVILGARVTGLASGGPIVAAGENVRIAIRARARETVTDATLGIAIRDRFGQEIFGINSQSMGRPIALAAGDEATFTFDMPMNLGPGAYSLTVAFHHGEHHLDRCYHWCDNLLAFEVAGFLGPRFAGICRLTPSFAMDVADRAHV